MNENKNEIEFEIGTIVELNPWMTGTIVKLGPIEATVVDARGRKHRIERKWLVVADNSNVQL